MYEPTAKKWAYALYKHCETGDTKTARSWLNEKIKEHEENGTATSHVPFPYERHSCRNILENLKDFAAHSANKPSRHKASEPLTCSENAWFNILRDAFTEEYFDFLFGFTKIHPDNNETVPNLSEASIAPALVKNESPAFSKGSDLEVIRARWHPKFESRDEVLKRLEGKYLIYRAHEVIKPNGSDTYQNPFGWFGSQKVRVIPLSLSEQDNCLKWHDYYPDPNDFIHETIGIVSQAKDKVFDIFGVDKEHPDHAKFFGRFKKPKANDVTYGAIFANNRYSGGVESYRFWLKKISEDEYQKRFKKVKELMAFFTQKENTVAQKYEKFYNDSLIFSTVADLLTEHESDLVHYLYLPDNYEPDDLRSGDIVRKIGYADIRKLMETF
ncbi:MAG: hypothetical protein ACRBBN_04685 [Methyloligellaceae bacterium]